MILTDSHYHPLEQPWYSTKDYRQTEIPFFWPLREQIPLDLDYGPSELLKECYRSTYTIQDVPGITLCSTPTWTTNIAPSLSVKPQNSVGQLNIGGIEIGLEKEPKWHQKVLYRLLGFNWKNK